MLNIYEVSAGQVGEVVQFFTRYWPEMVKRPLADPQEKELLYWQSLLRNGRIIVYRGTAGELLGLLSLIRDKDDVRLDHFLVDKDWRGQGIGGKLLQLADKMAKIWEAKRLVVHGREDQEIYLPFFYQMGYGFYCPVDQKGHITIEKRIN